MVYPRDVILKIMDMNNIRVYDLFNVFNGAGFVYRSFKENVFSDTILEKLTELTGVDLTIYNNSATRKENQDER